MLRADALLDAAVFAAIKHRDQRRKDASRSPYINHPLSVANVLASEAGIQDRDLLIAALLHDTVEDTDTTFAEIEERYGARVRRLVEEVTDDKRLERSVRKERQIISARAASDAAKQLKLADKIGNVRDIAREAPAGWSEAQMFEYVRWSVEVVEGCRGVNATLDLLFDEAVAAAHKTLGLDQS